jgi:tripartite-type tricarboxylate transporter receptor subunit TctC
LGRELYVLALTFFLATSISRAALATTHDFYKGKTVRILIGASAGGAFATWGRMIGRHLGKQIPGNPVVVAENVTGAGGLILANQVKRTKPDRLTIATFNGGLLMDQILGRPGIEFDARRFEYLDVARAPSRPANFGNEISRREDRLLVRIAVRLATASAKGSA